MIAYFKHLRSESASKIRPNNNQKVLQNAHIQNLIKKKITKMVNITSPVRKKKSMVERKENKSIPGPHQVNNSESRKILVNKNEITMRPVVKMAISKKLKNLQSVLCPHDSNVQDLTDDTSHEHVDTHISEDPKNMYDDSSLSPRSAVDHSLQSCYRNEAAKLWQPPKFKKSISKVLFTQTPDISFSYDNTRPEINRSSFIDLKQKSKQIKMDLS